MKPDIEKRYAKLMEIASQKMTKLQAEVDSLKQSQREPIAVIGMACRFPGGANTPEQLWQLLKDGVDTIDQPAPERWQLIGMDGPLDLPDSAPLYGGFINNIDQFDSQFFGIAPREAKSLDPQQRLLLEIGWEALEYAGIAPASLQGSATGVFMGVTSSDYQYLFNRSFDADHPPQTDSNAGVYLITGNSLSAVAGRLSYNLGLTGPAVITDTSCSSSLVTVHQACQSLRSKECNLALAGGISLMIRIDSLARYFAGQVFAADGRCKVFDTRADSFGRGEGCGLVVLKRLSEAVADGDNILAVIQGSMINQDGRTNGMTAPNGTAQQAVIGQALAHSQVKPEQIDYIEAHGTGTAIGDPVELEALNAIFGKRTDPLWVGSIKSNMGHLEGAAGIVGLMKAVLVLQHDQIPPNLHFNQPNSYVDWESSPIEVPTQLTPWPESRTPRMAGVSSFGFSGTNAHLILAEAPPRFDENTVPEKGIAGTDKWHLLTLSAKTPEALMDLVQCYHDYLLDHSFQRLEDICYTAQTGRTHFRHRLSITADSVTMLQSKLKDFGEGQTPSGLSQGHQIGYRSTPKIAFLFTGQGSQYPNMGRELYETEPVFRQALDRCNEQLAMINEQFSLLDVLYPTLNKQELDQDKQEPDTSVHSSQFTIHNSQLNQTRYTQPVLFALEYALAHLWQSWGVKPTVVMGHSLGEIVAACVAGIFSLEDALKLVVARGQLMQALPLNGRMVSVRTDETRVKRAIAAHAQVAIAAVNGPHHVVISGEQEAIQSIVTSLQAEGVKTHALNVSHAFHSPLIEPMLAEFRTVAQGITYHAPHLAIISNISGQLIPARDKTVSTPDYWVRHARECVQFVAGIDTLSQQDIDICIEIGPKPILLNLAHQCLPEQEKIAQQSENSVLAESPPSIPPKGGELEGSNKVIPEIATQKSKILWLPSLRPNIHDSQQIRESLGVIYTQGVSIDWVGFNQGHTFQKISLPTYPFQRQSYWLDIPTAQPKPQKLTSLIDRMIKLPQHNQIIFETELNVTNLPFLVDHQVYEMMVLPGAAYVALTLHAATLVEADQPYHIDDVVLLSPLIISPQDSKTIQLILTATNNNQYEFQIISFAANTPHPEPITHATGQINITTQPTPSQISVDELQRRYTQPVNLNQPSADLVQSPVTFGPAFQWMAAVWQADSNIDSEPTMAALGKLQRPAVVDPMTGHRLHPGLLDACFQVAGFAVSPEPNAEKEDVVWLPFAINQIKLYRPLKGEQWWCLAQSVSEQGWDIQLLDPAGQVVADILGLQVRAATPNTVLGADVWRQWLYTVDWQPTPVFGLPPDYLPTPAQIHKIVSENSLAPAELPETYPSKTELQHYQTALNHLEAISLDYIVDTFEAAGIPLGKSVQAPTNNEGWSIDDLMQQLAIIPPYRRLLARLLAILVEMGLLQYKDGQWYLNKSNDVWAEPDLTIAPLLAQYGAVAEPEILLLKRCGENLGQVLRGAQNPLALLFPEGMAKADNETATAGQNSPGIQVMSYGVQQAVLTAIEQRPSHRGLRILEVGAGTGSTTAWLLPQLPANQTSYHFTDISAAFFPAAKEKFAAYDFVQYKTLDLEQSPLEQKFTPGYYDLIVAANVVHATQNVKDTLTHIRQLLAPGGILVLWEATTRQRWVDLTFGLTDGWWRFADSRTEHPLLNDTQWQNTLLDCGFQDVSVLSDEMLGQSVIMAQASVTPQSISPQRPWLIFADQHNVASTLTSELKSRGEQPILVRAGHTYQQIDETTFDLNPDNPAEYQQLIEAVPEVYGVVYLWGLDTPPLDSSTEVSNISVEACGWALYLVQALLQANIQPAGLWLVTQQTQLTTHSDSLKGFAQASLWGLGRNIALEAPHLNCICVDLAALDQEATLTQQTRLLGNELLNGAFDGSEAQVAFRGNTRYVARLADDDQPATSAEAPLLTLPDQPCQLQSTQPGTLDNLTLQATPRQLPAANQVEIRVRATGLNFIDVLDALGLLPFQRVGGLGGECAGEIVAVGEDVQGLQPGDRVVTLAPGCFSQYVTVSTDMVLPLPDHLTFAQAATIPVNFLTAYNALHQVGHISAGDRVLVHAAAGGTGMAAVKLAQLAGAEVFATASPGKWETLKTLGIKHIYNSRTPDFAEKVLADTEGQGVDIVLNSLTGEGFVEQSLIALAPQGRFLEIAKLNVWSQAHVNAFRADVSYHLVDLPLEPDYLRPIFIELMAQFKADSLQPLPHTAFPLPDAVNAFRFMQQAKHIGKVVITQDVEPEIVIQPEGTYLITGGLSGLGLLVARWLIEQGATQLMLVGRSQPTPEAQVQLDALSEAGAMVTVVQADVTIKAQLAEALARIKTGQPLRGVIHSVGVLDNAPLSQQNAAHLSNVMAPKIEGAWNLHHLTRNVPLDFFVLFSSAVGLLGNHGQANHAAANTFLDAFAAYRRAQGLPALSIDWGAWAEVGAAAETIHKSREQMATQGLGVISPSQGLAVLGHLLARNMAQVAVLPIDWPRFLASQTIASPLFADILAAVQHQSAQIQPSSTPVLVEAAGVFRQVLEKIPARKRPQVLMTHLHSLITNVLSLPSDHIIPPQQGLMELGLDSLMAIELRNQLSHNLDHPLSATVLFDYPTMEEVTHYLISIIFDAATVTDEISAQTGDDDQIESLEQELSSAIDDLTEDEVAALLAQEIESLKQE